jgi:ATPase subunit of ABC transporter with duplicated ATPase domains
VSFKVDTGEHAALVGANGAGKSTILRILAGELTPGAGSGRCDGGVSYLPQTIGVTSTTTIRGLLLSFLPPDTRVAGEHLADAERRLAAGDLDAGVDVGIAIGEWSEVGGYQIEASWDASIRRALDLSLDAIQDRLVGELSGGELKRLAIDAVFASPAETVLLDEPDNYLDLQGVLWLQDLVNASKKTVLMISHDREFLEATSTRVVTLEGAATWVHGAGYSSYAAARDARQATLGNDLQRWNDEERRLFQNMKLMKQRAAVNPKNAPRANAAETRWRRFTEAGPPTPPHRRRRSRSDSPERSRRGASSRWMTLGWLG